MYTNKKIRVVHVLHSFGTGGLEKGVATIVTNASPDFEHIIVCLTQSGDSRRLLPSHVQVKEMHKPDGNSIGFILNLSKVLRNLKPNIVHTRNWGGVDGIIAARLAGLNTIVHGEHGFEVQDPEGGHPKRVIVRRMMSRLVREYTCVSRQIKGWLEQKIKVKKPVTQIYNGVDFERYGAQGPKEAGPGASGGTITGRFIIGMVGRLDPIKDHPTLFRAFDLVKNKVPEARLLVIGDGPERTSLEALAGEGISFMGNRSDVPEILKTLSLFVLPSINEGISNTILEAMAAGLPVVATNVGGNPELIQDGVTGSLVEKQNAEATAAAMLEYYNDPDLRLCHGNAGRKSVFERFSIEKMVSSYESVYRRVAGR